MDTRFHHRLMSSTWGVPGSPFPPLLDTRDLGHPGGHMSPWSGQSMGSLALTSVIRPGLAGDPNYHILQRIMCMFLPKFVTGK